MMGRFFLGIAVPPDRCGEALVRVEDQLAEELDVKRWYTPEQFHLTTHFLGELTDDQVASLLERISLDVQQFAPFSLQLDRVGSFPQAKVVWCGVGGDLAALHRLYDVLTVPLRSFGADRFLHDRFRPHITLGRLRTADSAWQPADFTDLFAGARWDVTSIHLFESVSAGAAGPHYPIRHTFHFSQ